jgi:hypothetical protein
MAISEVLKIFGIGKKSEKVWPKVEGEHLGANSRPVEHTTWDLGGKGSDYRCTLVDLDEEVNKLIRN